MNNLTIFIDAWRDSARAILDLDLTAEEWDLPSDLPGWSVRDILAHLSHLEAETEPPRPEKTSFFMPADITEPGVDARRSWSIEQVHEEFRTAFEARSTQLEDVPEDPTALVDRIPGGLAWDWQTALRNRAFDMWMHEQDIRRAVNQPGNMFTSGGQIASAILASTMPFVVAKKAGAEPGTTVRWLVHGPLPLDLTVLVDDEGKGRVSEETPEQPTTTLSMDSETFIVLGGGRRYPQDVTVDVSGDTELGARVLEQMALKV